MFRYLQAENFERIKSWEQETLARSQGARAWSPGDQSSSTDSLAQRFFPEAGFLPPRGFGKHWLEAAMLQLKQLLQSRW